MTAADPSIGALAVRAVTWDATGTLFTPHPGVGAVYAEIAARHGLERDADGLDRAFPAAFKAVQARWGVPSGADDEDARRFWVEVVTATFAEPLPHGLCMDCFDAFASALHWRVLPGVREALALIAGRGLPMAVVSNFDGRLPRLIADLGLGPFAAIVTSAIVGRAKPDPAVLREACRRLGVEPGAALHLGDHPREDGAMCAALGVRWLPVDPAVGVPIAALTAILAAP